MLPEGDELYRGTVMDDHCGPNALGRRTWWMDDVLPLESSVEVIHFEGDMRNGADEFVNGAVFLEPHPLDAVGTGAEADDEEPELLEVGFAGMGDGRWNANVVVPPPELSRDRRWFVIEPSSEVKTVRSGLWRGDGSVGNGYLVKETLENDGAGSPNVGHQWRAKRVHCMPRLDRSRDWRVGFWNVGRGLVGTPGLKSA